MNPTKAAILAEMLILLGGGLILHRSAIVGTAEHPDWDTLVHSVKLMIAITVVGAVLLTMDDLGAGTEAAAFGGLLAMGYLLSAGGALGPQLVSLEQGFFGSSGVMVAQPPAQRGKNV